jgi:hypothetical protein
MGKILRDSHQQRCALNLLHMLERASVMGLERTDDLKGRRDDMNCSVIGTYKEALGSRADAGCIILDNIEMLGESFASRDIT